MPWVGPAVLRPEHLRAMQRVLERELPSYVPPPSPEPLPIWVPPSFDAVDELLPTWEPPPAILPEPLEVCPGCGEGVAIERIDLTANAGWFICRSCSRRWGGTIERERGRAVTG